MTVPDKSSKSPFLMSDRERAAEEHGFYEVKDHQTQQWFVPLFVLIDGYKAIRGFEYVEFIGEVSANNKNIISRGDRITDEKELAEKLNELSQAGQSLLGKIALVKFKETQSQPTFKIRATDLPGQAAVIFDQKNVENLQWSDRRRNEGLGDQEELLAVLPLKKVNVVGLMPGMVLAESYEFKWLDGMTSSRGEVKAGEILNKKSIEMLKSTFGGYQYIYVLDESQLPPVIDKKDPDVMALFNFGFVGIAGMDKVKEQTVPLAALVSNLSKLVEKKLVIKIKVPKRIIADDGKSSLNAGEYELSENTMKRLGQIIGQCQENAFQEVTLVFADKCLPVAFQLKNDTDDSTLLENTVFLGFVEEGFVPTSKEVEKGDKWDAEKSINARIDPAGPKKIWAYYQPKPVEEIKKQTAAALRLEMKSSEERCTIWMEFQPLKERRWPVELVDNRGTGGWQRGNPIKIANDDRRGILWQGSDNEVAKRGDILSAEQLERLKVIESDCWCYKKLTKMQNSARKLRKSLERMSGHVDKKTQRVSGNGVSISSLAVGFCLDAGQYIKTPQSPKKNIKLEKPLSVETRSDRDRIVGLNTNMKPGTDAFMAFLQANNSLGIRDVSVSCDLERWEQMEANRQLWDSIMQSAGSVVAKAVQPAEPVLVITPPSAVAAAQGQPAGLEPGKTPQPKPSVPPERSVKPEKGKPVVEREPALNLQDPASVIFHVRNRARVALSSPIKTSGESALSMDDIMGIMEFGLQDLSPAAKAVLDKKPWLKKVSPFSVLAKRCATLPAVYGHLHVGDITRQGTIDLEDEKVIAAVQQSTNLISHCGEMVKIFREDSRFRSIFKSGVNDARFIEDWFLRSLVENPHMLLLGLGGQYTENIIGAPSDAMIVAAKMGYPRLAHRAAQAIFLYSHVICREVVAKNDKDLLFTAETPAVFRSEEQNASIRRLFESYFKSKDGLIDVSVQRWLDVLTDPEIYSDPGKAKGLDREDKTIISILAALNSLSGVVRYLPSGEGNGDEYPRLVKMTPSGGRAYFLATTGLKGARSGVLEPEVLKQIFGSDNVDQIVRA